MKTDLLHIEYLHYSPDMACRPTVLFPNAQKGKYDQQLMRVPPKGPRRRQELLLEIAMMEIHFRPSERVERGVDYVLEALLRAAGEGKGSGWQE